ncbi:MAG: hypothetical protein WBA24_03060 [Geitlerinemataceae cyanobacterium]
MRTPRTRQTEKGLTLMEALVAILMVSAVMVAISPPIFLAVATRVQNRRAEQAIQLAHGEIDQVRVLVEGGINTENKKQLPGDAGNTDPAKVAPPGSTYKDMQSTNFECSDYDREPPKVPVPVTEARLVDVNGDCNKDFLVQTFIANTQEIDRGGDRIPIIFNIGVRVYSIAAESNLGNLTVGEDGSVKAASLKLTTGEGQQTDRPLAVLYTTLGQGDSTGALEKYRCLAGAGENCN